MNAKPSQTRRKHIRHWTSRIVLLGACATLALAIAVWWMLAATVDRHWLGTVIAMGPRWILLVPVLLLFPAAAFVHRGAAVLLAVSGAIVAGPVMKLSVPWTRCCSISAKRPAEVRVLTCNVGGQKDLRPLARLIVSEQPVLVACQEWPAGADWPLAASEHWYVAQQGGLLVASRYPLSTIASRTSPVDSWRTTALACDLQTERGTLRCVCIHLLTPRRGLEAIVQRGLAGASALTDVNAARREESRLVADWVNEQQAAIVLGDFNMVEESRFYAGDWSSRQNAWSRSGIGWGYTKWTRLFGVRIDHVLCDLSLSCQRAWLGPTVGSDHLPLLADFARGSP